MLWDFDNYIIFFLKHYRVFFFQVFKILINYVTEYCWVWIFWCYALVFEYSHEMVIQIQGFAANPFS